MKEQQKGEVIFDARWMRKTMSREGKLLTVDFFADNPPPSCRPHYDARSVKHICVCCWIPSHLFIYQAACGVYWRSLTTFQSVFLLMLTIESRLKPLHPTWGKWCVVVEIAVRYGPIECVPRTLARGGVWNRRAGVHGWVGCKSQRGLEIGICIRIWSTRWKRSKSRLLQSVWECLHLRIR